MRNERVGYPFHLCSTLDALENYGFMVRIAVPGHSELPTHRRSTANEQWSFPTGRQIHGPMAAQTSTPLQREVSRM